MNPDRERIVEEIASRLGEPGLRARDFLVSADALVGPLAGSTPKSSELAAYAVREALTSITAGIGVSGSRFRHISRSVLEASDAAQSAPEDPVAAANLLSAIEELRAFTKAPTGHESQMIELILRRTGNEPLRLEPDPVAEYQDLVELAAESLHSSAEDAEHLLNRAFELLGRLFAPADVALAELDRFIAIANPTPEDAAQLAEHLISAAHLRYFAERAAAPGWLEVLRGSRLAQPHERWGWPVGELAIKIASDDPEFAAAWLADAVDTCTDLNSGAAFHFARTAAGVGLAASGVLIRVAKQRPLDPSVRAFADQLLTAASPEDEFVYELADVYLNSPLDEWFAGELLRAFAAGVTSTNFAGRLELLGHKLRGRERAQPMSLDVALSNVGPLAELTITDELLGGTQYLIAGAVAVVRRAIELVPADSLLNALAVLPAPVAERLRAWLLGTAQLGSTADAITSIADAIRRDGPSEDHLAVIDRAWSDDPAAAAAVWMAALGTPPPQDELDGWIADRDKKLVLWRNRTWSAALPSSVVSAWRPAAEAVAGRPVPGRAAIERTAVITSGWGHTPIPMEHLQQLAPSDAAAEIAAWRPSAEDFLASPLELGRAHEEVVAADPDPWAAALPGIVTDLRHPTYIAHLLSGFRQKAESLVPYKVELLDAVALVASEPWAVQVLDSSGGADFDNTWTNARAEGRSLLEALAFAGVDVVEERPDLLDMVIRDALDRSDQPTVHAAENPVLSALNRSSMKALQTAIVLGWRTVREGRAAPPAVLDLLDTVLALDGADGLQARAIVARALDHIREMAPDWMAQRHNLLFGADAPDSYGQRTVDFALNRTTVAHWMLIELRPQLYRAAEAGVPNGQSHVLIAMVHDVDGYSVGQVADWLKEQDPASVSGALSTLGYLLRKEGRPAVIDRGLALVEALRAQQLTPEAFAGLGLWWGMDGVDHARWTSLMLEASSSGTSLRDPSHVAQHAILEVTNDTFTLLRLLLVNAGEPWESSMVATEALAALRAQPEPSAERASLRAVLLERGYFQAQDL